MDFDFGLNLNCLVVDKMLLDFVALAAIDIVHSMMVVANFPL